MADLYSDIPELAAQDQAIQRRKKIAEAMLARGQQPLETTQMAGNVVAPISWTQGLAQLANAYFGAKQAEKSDKEYSGLADKRRQMVADEMAKITAMQQGVPGVEGIEAQPERTIQAPAPMQPNQQAPNYNTVPETVPGVEGRAAVPAVAPDKRGAIMQALMSNIPELQRYGTAMQAYETLDQNQKFKSEEAKATRDASAEQRQLDREAKMEVLKEQIRSREMMGEQANDLKMAMANLMAESRTDAARIAASGRSDGAPVAVIDENGNPTYVSRSDAIGKTPASQSAGGMTASQKIKYDKQKSQDHTTVSQTEQTINEIKRSISDIRGSKGLKSRTGLSGYIPAQIQGEEARKAQNRIETLKGKVTQMGKAMASLSGAIGPMAVQEWKIVSDAVTAIDPTAGNFEEQLSNIERQADGALTRVKDKYEMQYDDNTDTNSNNGLPVKTADDFLKKHTK